MTKHRTDLVALLFGLAFVMSGAIVIATQATNIDVDPHWGAAVGLIVLGVVALAATIVRAGREASHSHDSDWPLTPRGEPADHLGDG